MDRRAFLKTSAAAAAAATSPLKLAQAAESWHTYEVTSRVEVIKPGRLSRAWLPLPLDAHNGWQKALGNAWKGNARQMRLVHDPHAGVPMLYAEWDRSEPAPVLELTSRVMTRERRVDLSRPDPNLPDLSPWERERHLLPTALIPTDGIVRTTALAVTKNARTDLEKARAIYEWMVDNTYRDPKTKGCGWGDIKNMLESGHLGGKCGDLSAIFVGLARSVGVPARDVYGVRVGPSKYGYVSLGANSPDISKAQHCRAEFFAVGYGWVPVDPADVSKVILEEPPGHLPATNTKVVAARKRLFGDWEMNWMAYNTGHDVRLPHADAPALPYLMYINAESAGEMRDQLDPPSVRYSISSRELSA